MDQITYSDFAKVEFRIGQIVETAKVETSDKLIRMVVDFGNDERRIVFSGIYKWYKPEDLLNKKTVFVMNIEPKKIMGEASEAMIFGADNKENDQMSLMVLDKDVPNGSVVF